MTDIAELAYEIDSDDVARANRRLDKMGDEAADAERKTSHMAASIRRSFGAVGQAASRMNQNLRALMNRFRVLAAAIGAAGIALLQFHAQISAVSAGLAGIVVGANLEPFIQRLRQSSDSARELRRNMQQVFDISRAAGVNVFGAGESISMGLAAGMSPQVLRQLASAMSAYGLATDEVNDKLLKFVAVAKRGRTTVDDLLDILSFTADPAQALANALGVSVDRIRSMQRSGVALIGTLDNIGQYLQATTKQTDTLGGAWNRLVTAFAELMRTFNQTGAMQAVIGLLHDLTDWLRSQQASNLIKRLAQGFMHFVNVTLPQVVQAIYQNWDKIVAAFTIAIGTLIGTATGGLYGGLIGALISSFIAVSGKAGELQGDLGKLAQAVNNPAFRSGLTFIKDVFLMIAEAVAKAIAKIGTMVEMIKNTNWADLANFMYNNMTPAALFPGTETPFSAGGRSAESRIKQLMEQEAAKRQQDGALVIRITEANGGPAFNKAGALGLDLDKAAGGGGGNGFKIVPPETPAITGMSEAERHNIQSIRKSQRAWSAYFRWQKQQYLQAQRQARNAYNGITEYAVQAAHNIQDSFARFLFKPFENGLDGMLKSFFRTIRKMAANIAASKILSAILGPQFMGGQSAQVGGFLGNMFAGFFADGGVIPPGHWGIAGEDGMEVVSGGTSGATVTPMGGDVSIIINNNGEPLDVISQNERQTPNGREIEVMVESAVNKNLRKRGSIRKTFVDEFPQLRSPGTT